MLVRKYRQAFFVELLLFAGFVACSNWGENNVVLPPASNPPSNSPFAPIQPNQPYQPDQPNQPYQPDQPNQPYQTDQPNQPYQPDQPNQPYQPDQPNQPYQPDQPNQPYQPDQPTQPTQPTQPVLPFPKSSFGCESICTMAVSSVALYYWPQASTNTACLSTVPSPPSPTIPPGLNPATSTVYVYFISLTIRNGCGSIIASYPTSTASIPQDQLSSIDANFKAQPYNLADLPCPPPNIHVPPGKLYQPQMAWVGQFYGFADPAIAKQCQKIGGSAGFLDPPTAFVTAIGGLGGTGKAGVHPGHLKREPAKAIVAPYRPARTTTAT